MEVEMEDLKLEPDTGEENDFDMGDDIDEEVE